MTKQTDQADNKKISKQPKFKSTSENQNEVSTNRIGDIISNKLESNLDIIRSRQLPLQLAQQEVTTQRAGQVHGNQQLQTMLNLSNYGQVESLQRSVIQRADPIDLGVIEVTTSVAQIGVGRTPQQEIERHLAALQRGIQNYWRRYSEGLENFETLMAFESAQEAEPDYLKASLKATAKFILDQAIGKLAGSYPVLGQIANLVKGVAEAWVEEQERAETASGGVEIGQYIVAIRNSIGDQEQEMLTAIEDQKIPASDEYSQLDVETPEDLQPSPEGVLVGEAASFINDLRDRVTDFQEAIPDAALFQQRFTETFAAREGWTDLVSQGGRPAGQLYLSLDVYNDGDSWSTEDIDDAWTLATTAPKPERLAANLKSSLNAQGLSIYESTLPKSVSIRVEVEEDWALNDYYRGSIYFTNDPDNYELRGWYQSPYVRRAWETMKHRILGINKIEGSDD